MLIVFALATLCAIVFGRVAGYPFISYDDTDYIINNPYIRDGFSFSALKWAITGSWSANWHPLTWVSHMLDIEMFGFNPWGHHLTNVALHFLGSVTLFLGLRRMTRETWLSAFVAALFVVHPLRVESVAWISERKDVLSGLFFGLILIAYARYAESRAARDYILVCIFFALGIMSKSMLVTVPIVLIILDYWPLRRFALKTAVVEKLPLIAISGGAAVAAVSSQQGYGSLAGSSDLALGVRGANALYSYVVYLGKTLWPAKLALFYPHPANTLPEWRVALSALLLAAITLLAFIFRKKSPYIFVGWLWYLVMLIPVIGLVQVGAQAMADRYTYLPIIGVFIAIIWSLRDLAAGNTRMITISAGIVLILLTVSAWVQVGYWKDSETLFKRALAVTSRNSTMHTCLGLEYANRRRPDEAIDQFNKALRINPDAVHSLEGIAVMLASQGKLAEAAPYFRRAVELDMSNPQLWFRLATIETQLGHYNAAKMGFERVLQLDPARSVAHNNLAVILYQLGDYAAAWGHVHSARSMGLESPPGFLRELSKKMVEPVE